MGKESPTKRKFKVRQKQKRREKVKKLKEKLKKAQSEQERQRIIDKILKIAPHYYELSKDFLGSAAKKSK